MEKTKNKFKEFLSNKYLEIKECEKQLNEGFSKIQGEADRLSQMVLGNKMWEMNSLNTELLTGIYLFTNILEFTIEDLPTEVKDYYLQLEELKKPISDIDPEEVKKIKEMINSYKKDG